ncbi:MAG: TRAP transporter large permease [Bacteroidota bacterium]
MIAVVFLLILLAAMLAVAAAGAGGELPIAEVLVLVGVFCVFFGAGIYIAAALGVLGLIVGYAFSDRPFWDFIGQMIWGPSSSFVLVAVPLFLLMGEILLRAGVSDQLYRSLNVFLRRLPGGLLHTNIVSCGVFSAVSGSSVATAATMGSVALPYFRDTPYSPRVVLGSLAAGGALGNLIPPGITFIIYGLITETSVGKLYLAALGPSALVVVLFIAYIAWHGLRNPIGAPAPGTRAGEEPIGIAAALAGLVPTVVLIGVVLGTIYAGLATATESAALGVAGAVALAALRGKLSLRMLNEAAVATARTTAMIGLILFGAYLLNFILTSIQVPQKLASMVAGLPLPPWAIMALIIGFYLALGTFMEGFSMIITTIPIVFPIVKALGYDPIWFGVIITMLVEIAMISPPDGTVLYVLQGMRPDPGAIGDVFRGVLPFVVLYVLAIVLLMVAPEIALWLPRVLA